ncbi:receptor-like protein eix1, partial [Quercus suber]
MFTIDIGKNEFDGSIPKWIGHRLSSLMILSLHSNNFYGQIPDEICALTSLQILDLSHNKLFGSIPRCVNNFSMIARNNNSNDPLFLINWWFESSSRPFESQIPQSMSTLTFLSHLNLSNNNLIGRIPSSTQLQSLNASSFFGNKLCGPPLTDNCTMHFVKPNIENKWGKDIGGQMVDWFFVSMALGFVVGFWVVVGPLFWNKQWRILYFQFLDHLGLVIRSLHSNNFYGYIPEKLCHLTSLQILDLSNNKLFGSNPRCIDNFNAMATNNNSNGPLFLVEQSIGYGTSMLFESALLVIKGKVLEYSTTLQFVKNIDLSKNNLSGKIPKKIPANIGVMRSLESIDFSVNQLSGQIPQSMSSLTFLSQLNLSNNNLSGKIPSSTQLQSLNASCFIGNKLCEAPLIENCSIIDVKANVENNRSKDFGGPKVDWFYVSTAFGFV